MFRENDKLKMQNNFMFVDTETDSFAISKDVTELKFKLGCFVYWNRKEELIKRRDFFKVSKFWDYVENVLTVTKDLYLFAHNMDFDFKILDGYKQLFNRGFEVKSWYIQGKTFMIRYAKKTEKETKNLFIWDTMNYTPFPLKKIGKFIGLEKLNIDFDKDTDNKLLIYCRRDTEIVFRFIEKLVTFLLKYELSMLKPTSASLSLNIFRHKFYNRKNKPIFIHDWKKAIKLERDSYSGGITDCFKVGTFKERMYKLDINSMYPYVMKNFELPYKLVFWCAFPEYDKKKLAKIVQECKNNFALIIRCKINLPQKFAYILQKSKVNNQDKSIFLSGIFQTVLTSPEIDFVEKHGKILEVSEISVYKKRIIFDEFIEFFYNKRLEFKKDGNEVYEQFCKLIMNSQYGKWGQKNIKYEIIKVMEDIQIKNFGTIIDADTEKRYQLIQFGENLFKISQTEENSKDALVALCSFVTSYSRLLLVKYILKAKRKNLYYTDTDSVFVNKKGYTNLLEFIDKSKLGMLKLEEIARNVTIYRPKFYNFGDNFKCKGIKKTSKKLDENKDLIVFQQERWERFRTSLRNENIDKQRIEKFIKIVDKNYDKGVIDSKGNVKPYAYNE